MIGDDLDNDLEELDELDELNEHEPAGTLNGDIEAAVAQQLASRSENAQLAEYSERARANGRSLPAAVADYAKVETALRSDFNGGVEHLCQLGDVDPLKLAAQLQQRYSGLSGHQHALYQQQAQQQALQQETQAHREQVSKLEKTLPYFDELRPAMRRLADTGKVTSAKQAYSVALKANPTLHVKAIIARAEARCDRDMRKGIR